MTFHRCHISGEEAVWLEEEFRRQTYDSDGLIAYATAIGSASSPDYDSEIIGHDYDFVAVPRKSVAMGEFVRELYEVYRDVSHNLESEFSSNKISAPFPESHVQNQALHSAALEAARRNLDQDSSVTDLYQKRNEFYNDIVPIHTIACASITDMEQNLPPGFIDAMKDSEPLLGEFADIPENRYSERGITMPYLEGFHKHSGALASPETFSDTQVTGAVVHGIDQAEKETGIELIAEERKGELENDELTLQEEIYAWESALRNLDDHTETIV